MALIFFLVLTFFGSLNDFSDGCNVGFYGASCSKKCPNFCHDNECNVTTGKCLSCVKGYYSNITKDCVRCPEHCTACSSYTFCFACVRGFKGEVCEDNCTNCRPDTSCDKNTGYCFENCSEGLSGELCNIPCDSKCKSCDRHNTSQCISCADDENGKSCKEECFKICLSNTCNESHGSCAEECLSGYATDKTCNRTCSSHCKDICKFKCKELEPPGRPSSPTSKANIGLTVGLVFGSIVIFVSITVYLIRRRLIQSSYCRCMSSDRTQDQNRTSKKHDVEHIKLLPQETEESRKTIETRVLPSAAKLTVLQMQGAYSAIEKKNVDLKVSVDKTEVTVEGYPLDIQNAFKEIEIKCDKIEHIKYKHSKSREWVFFFQTEQTNEYVKTKLEQKQMIGTWDITDTELTVFVPGKGNSENFKNTLLESVLEISPPVDKSLLSSEWWGEFLIEIQRKFKEKVIIFTKEQQDVVIICTDDVVQYVKQEVNGFLDEITDAITCEPGVCEFVSKYWNHDDKHIQGVKIKTEANGILLRGLLENVDQVKQKLNLKLQDICSRQPVLEKTGIFTVLETVVLSGTISDIEKEFKCVMKLPQKIDESHSVITTAFEVTDSHLLEEIHQESDTITSPFCFQTRRHMIKIQIIQGDIVHQKADVIVVGAASDLDLQSGSAFDSALEHGGPKLKTDYNRRYPNGIHNGEVAVIDSGNFKCDKIYLTSLPPWKEASRNGGKVLRNFMRECLRLADKFDKNSIAFSIRVTGETLGYPIDMAVSVMYRAVAEFDSIYSKTSLKEINIIEEDDDETIKTCIMRHLKKQAGEDRTERIFIEDGTILTKRYEDTKYRMVKDGCVIGSIQLHIQIGDLLNCTEDAILTEVGAYNDSKENDRVVITDNVGLKAKHVIQVQSQDTLASWRSELVYCLEKCGKEDVKSVALTVVGSGTGTKTFSPDGIGACLFAAIDDFTSQNPDSSVTDVRLVVPDSNAGCIPDIIAALQYRTSAVNFQWGIGNIFKSQLGFLESNVKESSYKVFSDSTVNIERCINALDDRIGLEFAKKVIDVDKDVIILKDKKINSIIDSDILVDVTSDKKTGQFTIFGPLRNVLAAVNCLHNKMQQYKRKENNAISAKVLYDQTKWHWLSENQTASLKEVSYDMMTNFIIETAYKAGTQTVELQSKDGKIYVIDFQMLVEYLKVNVNNSVMVIRRDIINPGILKDLQVGVQKWFSKSWIAMNKNENVLRVALDDGKEYQKVETLFLGEKNNGRCSSKDNSRSIQIVKIERIQNTTLYKQYKTKKYAMKQQKPGCKQTERRLWHETSEERVRWIINNGFNRSYCGVQEVLYGQGVYFAADTSYSAQRYLAENKPGVQRYMFLAKVLTGELIKGQSSIRVLPLVNPAHPNVMYDSAVDDVNKPTQFVIFHDKQAYPEYLITYTS